MTDPEYLKELLDYCKEQSKYHQDEVRKYKQIICKTRKEINKLKNL